ncbi:hypothetical protein DEO23_08180 [Brachybacterium endophyticum]|uniref:Uncharacterized protein n=1 Tax=Brachybacterium endophyticum TaxID=2182385 RepID=A0A2U2RLV9_9MICO|nr:hypothetical protein [Brachybacterium endophyticum]PWH06867.1 hypothetical protein DEO23_08180 [Brachybacterium endophyticum]
MDIASRRIRLERERIRSDLLSRAPALERRLTETSSGSLVASVPGGDAIEVGRLPVGGATSWVVVERRGSRIRVLPCRSARQVVDTVLSGLRAVHAA